MCDHAKHSTCRGGGIMVAASSERSTKTRNSCLSLVTMDTKIVLFTLVFIILATSTIAKVIPKPDENKDDRYYLYKDPTCKDDAKKLCENVNKENNFAIFVCLQEKARIDDEDVSDECHETLWHYKFNLTRDDRFDEALFKVCESEINNTKLVEQCKEAGTSNQPGFLLNCLIEHRQLITNQKCSSFVQRMSAIVFADYRLLRGFYEDCHDDVKKTKCGILSDPKDSEGVPHEQSEVIGCLEASIDEVSDKCQKQLLRVAELQADDYHLDKPLFYACHDARDRFCHDVQAGEGRVYKCLLSHVNDEAMAEGIASVNHVYDMFHRKWVLSKDVDVKIQCANKLKARENLMQKNVKVNHALWRSCEDDFNKYNCGDHMKDKKTDIGEASWLLLCLKEQEAKGNRIAPKCQAELRSFAMMIVDNLQVSPIIVAKCDSDIHKYCQGVIDGDGEMMDCLMTAATNNSLTTECFEAVSEVLKETGAGNNYKVDRALYKACEPVISTLCSDKEDMMVLGCLMDNAHSPKMPEECATQVFHLQYFLSRDFRLDTSLYRDCKVDAEKVCNAADFQERSETKDGGSLPDNFVIACLYRNSFNKSPDKKHQCLETCLFLVDITLRNSAGTSKTVHVEVQVSPQCSDHIRRVMHQRATNIRLMPEIEQPCLGDLGKHCYEKVEEGEDPEVSQKCQDHVKRVMYERGEDVKLHPKIEQACLQDLGKICLEKTAEHEEIDCLQQNYEQLSSKCKKAIAEFTEMESKDFDLDKHLVDKCARMVTQFCQQELEDGDGEMVLPCLVKHKNDVQMDHLCSSAVEHWQLLEMKDFNFSPALKDHCLADIRSHCGKSKTKFEAVKCLSENIVKDHSKVSAACRLQVKNELMVQEKGTSQDVDVKNQGEDLKLNPELFKECQKDIEQYCADVPSYGAQLEECLRRHHKSLSNPKCKALLFDSEKQEMEDNELDYRLIRTCKNEIAKFCSTQKVHNVLSCLRKFVDHPDVSDGCREVVFERQVEQAESFELDSELNTNCMKDVRKYCAKEYKDAENSADNGAIFGCLVDVFLKKKKKLQPSCESFVRQREREAARDSALNPQFMFHCNDEIEKLCPSLDHDDVIDCMKVHLPQISAHGCKEEVKKLIMEGMEDVHVDPHLQEKCARDIRSFCGEMPRRGGNVVLCLIDIFKAKNLHLHEECNNFMRERLNIYKSAEIDVATFDSVSAVIDAVAASPNRNYIYMTLLVVLAVLFIGGMLFGRVTKKAKKLN